MVKLMVCGYGRHGKDTFCERLQESGFKFCSSSWAACEAVIWPAWGIKFYANPLDCFNDRHNHRAVWFELIKAFNKNDKTRLARHIYKDHQVYCGIRSNEEFNAVKASKLFDVSIWIDASKRLPPESKDSCTVTPDMCDIVITNNGTIDEFLIKIDEFTEAMYSYE